VLTMFSASAGAARIPIRYTSIKRPCGICAGWAADASVDRHHERSRKRSGASTTCCSARACEVRRVDGEQAEEARLTRFGADWIRCRPIAAHRVGSRSETGCHAIRIVRVGAEMKRHQTVQGHPQFLPPAPEVLALPPDAGGTLRRFVK
jgi:hypothetical protein